MTKLLELQDISKSYEEDTILEKVSLTLEKGSALAIIGDSGGGKTTLLSIMGLLQQPTAGKIAIEGRDISKYNQEQLAHVRANCYGFVFQRARLINSLTAWENVLLPARLARSSKDFEVRARELLGQFGLEHRLYHRPQELSLGQLRRVALARALLLQPAIILADEPTNDLDPMLASSVADCLLAARDNGAGVVLVTHDPTLASRADKVFRLRDGCLALCG